MASGFATFSFGRTAIFASAVGAAIFFTTLWNVSPNRGPVSDPLIERRTVGQGSVRLDEGRLVQPDRRGVQSQMPPEIMAELKRYDTRIERLEQRVILSQKPEDTMPQWLGISSPIAIMVSALVAMAALILELIKHRQDAKERAKVPSEVRLGEQIVVRDPTPRRTARRRRAEDDLGSSSGASSKGPGAGMESTPGG
jgi:hypothetical protein